MIWSSTQENLFSVSNQGRLKLVCSGVENSQSDKVLYEASFDILLSNEQKIKALIRLH